MSGHRVIPALLGLLLCAGTGLTAAPANGARDASRPAAGRAAPAQGAATRLTATLRAATVPYGGAATVTGTLKAGRAGVKGAKVVVSARTPGSTVFATVATTRTKARGRWQVVLGSRTSNLLLRATSKRTARYRAARSKPVALTVPAPLGPVTTSPSASTARLGETRTWSGTTASAAAGTPARLQRDAGSGWVTIESGSVSSTGVITIAHVMSAAGRATYRLSLDPGRTLGGTAGPGVTIETLAGTAPTPTPTPTPAPTPTPDPLTITTSALPQALVGTAYDAPVAASGGSGQRLWSWSGDVPPGLVMGSGGRITGTPTAAGTYAVTLHVEDDLDDAARDLTLVVTRTTPLTLVTPSRLDDVVAGTAWSGQVTSSEPDARLAWSVASGSLPPGVTPSPYRGIAYLSGTPSTAGEYTFTLRATDGSRVATRAFSLTVLPAGSTLLSITTTYLPGGVPAQAYGFRFEANSATGLTWSANGSLPPGLTLRADGLLSGTPTAAGSHPFTVLATDGTRHASRDFVMTVADDQPGSMVITSSPPDGLKDVPYSAQLAVTGGAGAITWSPAGGSLPPGLALGGSGLLHGTPTATGSFGFDVQAQDGSRYALAHLTIAVTASPTPVIAEGTLPGAQVGVDYTYALHAGGGTTPYTWTVIAGTLPAGLSLNAGTGLLSGTPTAAGNSTFTLRVADAAARTGSQAVSLAVTAPDTSTAWVSDATRRSWAPYERTITAGNIDRLTTEYEMPAAGDRYDVRGNRLAQCVTDAGGTGLVQVLTLSTGALAWQRPGDCNAVRARPDRVLVSSGTGIASFDAATGAPQWDTATTDAGKPADRLLDVGALVLTAYGNRITAYRAADGTLAWQRTLSRTDNSLADWASDGTTLFVVESDGTVRGLSLATNGGQLWTTTVPGATSVVALPNRGEIALAGTQQVTWRSPSSGAVLRTWTTTDQGIMAISADDQRLYVGTEDACDFGSCSGFLHAVRHADAAQAWQADFAERVWSKPVVTDGIVWAAYSGLIRDQGATTVTAFDPATGQVLTQLDLPHPSGATMLAGAGRVVAPTYYRTYVLGVGPPRMELRDPVVPGGYVGRPYRSTTLSATGGTAPLTWSVAAGSLPPGLSLSPGGVVSGTPTSAGTSTATVRVTDAAGLSKSTLVRIAIRSVATNQWLGPGLSEKRNAAVLTMPLGEDDLATYAQRWQVPASTFGQDSEIAIGGGRAYAIRDYDTVAAYDVTSPSSTPVWTRTISGDSFVGGTVLSGTTLYVQTQNGAIVALDASTGAVAWQGPVTGSAGALKAAPVVVGGRVVYPTDNTLVAVDIATHAVAWSVAAPTYGSLATDGTRVYLWGKDSCALEAYRISDGGLAWSSTLLRAGEACVGPGGTGPVVDAGVVYSGTYYYGYHAFSATTGALLWSRRGTGGNDARLAVNENYLVSATGGQYGVIDVLDKQTGAVVYSGSAARSACGVTLVGDTALICPSSTLVAFDIVDRRVLWESGQLDYVDERPMVSGGRIYVRNAYGVLRAFGP